MKKALKWIGIGVGVLIGLLVVVGAVLYLNGNSRLNMKYEVQVENINVPNDEVAVARGRHLSEAVTLCNACHGDDLEGKIIDDEPGIATITASNLTAGRGGVANDYDDADWVRAIRHGISPGGRGLIIMHSDYYHNLSEEDLGAMIAYLKSVPAVDNEVPVTKARLLGKILVGLGMFDVEGMPLIPAEVIDHNAPLAKSLIPEVTSNYGRYLTSITVCSMCHGADFKGRPPLEPGSPSAPDITIEGELRGVSEQAFIDHFRSHADEEDGYMPWQVYARMTDDELTAIWSFLVSLSSNEKSKG